MFHDCQFRAFFQNCQFRAFGGWGSTSSSSLQAGQSQLLMHCYWVSLTFTFIFHFHFYQLSFSSIFSLSSKWVAIWFHFHRQCWFQLNPTFDSIFSNILQLCQRLTSIESNFKQYLIQYLAIFRNRANAWLQLNPILSFHLLQGNSICTC